MKEKFQWKKINLNKWLENKTFLWVMSLIIAVGVWGTIVYNLYPDTTKVIQDVPITINTQDTRIRQLGLNVISGNDTTVDVLVTARRYLIDSITADDIEVTALMNGVTAPGDATLELQATVKSSSNKEFTIERVTPRKVQVKFGRLVNKTFKVEVDVSGATIPEGFTMETAIPNPLEVTVSGPEEEITKISRAVVKVEADRELTSTETLKAQKIVLYDENNEPIISEHLKLDKESADVKLPVLKKKELPLVVKFINVPTGFDVSKLEYELSAQTVNVAGPAEVMDNYSELVVGYIDLKTLSLDSSYAFTVELPTDFVNLDNVTAVSVNFDTSGMKQKTFYVKNLSVVNAPANYDVSISTKSLRVTVIGPSSEVNEMTADDIVATVDISDQEILTGEYKAPVKVAIPGRGTVWPYGDYSVSINVSEK